MTKPVHGESGRRNGPNRPRERRSTEFSRYMAMRGRCLCPAHTRYARYGGRGVTICARWKDGEDGASGFECFVADMGRVPEPKAKFTLERNDTDGPYCADNCRWATYAEQNLNTSQTKYVTLDGMRVKLREAFAALAPSGLRYQTVIMRLRRGEDAKYAITRKVS